ncbi:MAG TPA: hypothetical protein VEH31_17245, partial [Streptosporangiaceae bacterium]|nr:hypothetical protein [Streptosporangiaceae bacterium]
MLGAQHRGSAERAGRGTPRHAVVALLIAIVALLLFAGAANAAPTITGFAFDSLGSPASGTTPARPFDILVYGSGFGAQPPPVSNSIPGYTGSDYGNALYFCNTTRGWCAGQNDGLGNGFDLIGLVPAPNYWRDSTGSSNPLDISGGSYFDDNVYQLQAGDQFSITIEGTTCTGTASTALGPVPCNGSSPPPPSPQHPTSTAVSCSPSTVSVGQQTTCAATVTDKASSGPTILMGLCRSARIRLVGRSRTPVRARYRSGR